MHRRRPTTLQTAHERPDARPNERAAPTPRASAAQAEYARLMSEAKQAFDRLTTEHTTARLARSARRSPA